MCSFAVSPCNDARCRRRSSVNIVRLFDRRTPDAILLDSSDVNGPTSTPLRYEARTFKRLTTKLVHASLAAKCLRWSGVYCTAFYTNSQIATYRRRRRNKKLEALTGNMQQPYRIKINTVCLYVGDYIYIESVALTAHARFVVQCRALGLGYTHWCGDDHHYKHNLLLYATRMEQIRTQGAPFMVSPPKFAAVRVCGFCMLRRVLMSHTHL